MAKNPQKLVKKIGRNREKRAKYALSQKIAKNRQKIAKIKWPKIYKDTLRNFKYAP